MVNQLSPVDLLTDPPVRNFFLDILSSTLSNEEKYEKFVDFFRVEEVVRRRLTEKYQEGTKQGGRRVRPV